MALPVQLAQQEVRALYLPSLLAAPAAQVAREALVAVVALIPSRITWCSPPTPRSLSMLARVAPVSTVATPSSTAHPVRPRAPALRVSHPEAQAVRPPPVSATPNSVAVTLPPEQRAPREPKARAGRTLVLHGAVQEGQEGRVALVVVVVAPRVRMASAAMPQARVVAAVMPATRRLRPTVRNTPHRLAPAAVQMHQAVSPEVPEVLAEDLLILPLLPPLLALPVPLARRAELQARTALAVRAVPGAVAAVAELVEAKPAALVARAARGARVPAG